MAEPNGPTPAAEAQDAPTLPVLDSSSTLQWLLWLLAQCPLAPQQQQGMVAAAVRLLWLSSGRRGSPGSRMRFEDGRCVANRRTQRCVASQVGLDSCLDRAKPTAVLLPADR